MKEGIEKILTDVSIAEIANGNLSEELRIRIKKSLPHGSLKRIQDMTGLHYNTVKSFDNPTVIKAAVKILFEVGRLKRHERKVITTAIHVLEAKHSKVA